MKPNTRLGQHFLVDGHILSEISAVADVTRSCGVLEIGPGEGALTAFLVQAGLPVVAIDMDPRAIHAVRARLGDAVQLVEGDALEADLGSLLPTAEDARYGPVVVGNLPYNVGSAIYRRLLTELGPRIDRMVLMLQREVAQRIVATPGTKAYGMLSILTFFRANAWSVLDVPPSAFRPPPKVHSSVLLIEPHRDPLLDHQELEGLMRFTARLFQARRKVLSNAFPNRELLLALDIDPRVRPECLSPEKILSLYRATLTEPSRSRI